MEHWLDISDEKTGVTVICPAEKPEFLQGGSGILKFLYNIDLIISILTIIFL
jgi:hypothetical protein